MLLRACAFELTGGREKRAALCVLFVQKIKNTKWNEGVKRNIDECRQCNADKLGRKERKERKKKARWRGGKYEDVPRLER